MNDQGMPDFDVPPFDERDYSESAQAHSGEKSTDAQPRSRKGYQNEVYANDSITHCGGFISDIRMYQQPGSSEPMYFVRVGLIQGSKKQGDEWVGDITNCDLLAGVTLKKWAAAFADTKNPFAGLRCRFVVKNLKFVPELYEGKPVLKSRGTLEQVTFGHID